MSKPEAYAFLKSLELRLAEALPAPAQMRAEVRQVVAQSLDDDRAKHKRQPEDAFLHHFAFPVLVEHLQTVKGVDAAAARKALLSEYFRNMPDMCEASPARRQRHPFGKLIGERPAAIMAQWQGASGGAPLKQSCPDFALQAPFPHSIVFEGKYFERGGKAKAETELVTNIYQAFFYRALPPVPATSAGPGYGYDYACLFAYDASLDGTLHAAWNALRPEIKAGFWEGANLYVMILRGDLTSDGASA